VSLTSCYRYVLELPLATLNDFLRAAFSESDGAASQQWSGVPVGGHLADVSVRPEDVVTHPPSLALTPVDLAATLHLAMRVEVEVTDIPDLDVIVYGITFDLPGTFQKDASVPPKLMLRFPGVTAAALNLVVSGGAITLTPELVEPAIHAMYDADPALGHTVRTGQPWVDLDTGSPTTVMVTIDIYDDEPGSPGFRGAISVTVDSATQITVHMPGHFKVQGVSKTYMNTDMTVDVKVPVQQSDGEIRVRLSAVTASDVSVTFATPSAYDAAAAPVMASEVAARISARPDVVQAIPTGAEVKALIEDRIVAMAGTLEFPLFTPPAPASGDQIDLTTFVPATVAQQVLALQIEPLGDTTPCDTPDVFARTTGFSIAVAAVKVRQVLDGLESDNEGSVREMQGHDVTLSRLDLSLADPGEHGQPGGHVWVDGTATASVDCWADPEVDFSGPVTLVPALDPDGTITVTADAGTFTADDPCCADVDPQDIADVIEGDSRAVGRMPTDFSGVGQLTLTVDACDISRAGIVIHGGLAVVTNRQLHAGAARRRAYWFTEPAAGG